MTSTSASQRSSWPVAQLRRTSSRLDPLLPRVVAGLPLLAIGTAHVLVAEAPMRPLVDAAGFPLPWLLAPLGVAAEILAGVFLLSGFWARIGGLLAIPAMLGATYAHLVIDVWPNGADNEPPLALPIAVALAASYVVVRGAGRWSLDHRRGTTDTPNSPWP
jgi:uncharacterized membrane protein YphA (DoxX/SURF4 family)